VKLPNSAYTSQPWRIHELAPDFRLEDVWGLRAPGGHDDFARAVHTIASGDASRSSSRTVRALFALRWRLGEILRWDGQGAGVGTRVATLRERLPADLRDRPGPAFASLPFTSLYLLEDEFAAETANRTMHGVMHLGWVPDPDGGHRVQMAVLVKPNGRFGDAYMAAIRPFRHAIVYPAMTRDLERRWRSRAPGACHAPVMDARIDVITLAVGDLDRALAFYRDGLGLTSGRILGTEYPGDEVTPAGAVAMFDLQGDLILALYPRTELAKDANIEPGPVRAGEFSIGHIVGSREEVDALLVQAQAAGATLTDQAHDRPWGIYSGYFHDPDGHLWEIIWNPRDDVSES
jgi:catechol 2,3-dioxygenase-like lactoylglutathione lyase family enzyme